MDFGGSNGKVKIAATAVDRASRTFVAADSAATRVGRTATQAGTAAGAGMAGLGASAAWSNNRHPQGHFQPR